MRNRTKHHLFLSAAACSLLLPAMAIASDWTNNGSGDYTNASNWSAGVPNAAGAIADFSTLNFSGDLSVTLNGLSPTVGSMRFGDTDNPGSPTSWEIRTDDAILPVITFDNSGSTPSISADPLGVTGGGFDDAFIGVEIATAADLNKEGDGKLTLAAPYNVPGTININAGHLNLDAPAVPTAGPNFAMTDGTELTIRTNFIDSVAVAAGATVTVNQFTGGGGSSFNQDIFPTGPGASLNFNVNGTGRVDLETDWAMGNSFENVMLASTEAGVATDVRLTVNAGNGWNANSFADTNVTFNNVRVFTRTNSGGNTILLGALSGDATSVIAGGNAGSAARYQIGALSTSTEFGGTLDGTGGMSINKVGTGTLTLSGGVSGTSPVLGANADPGRQGGVIRVSEGTIATSGTFDHFDGGDGTVNSTIDVKAAATLDVSGSTNTFFTVAQQQFIGAGTIAGAFDHQAGFINPADVGVADNDTDLTNELVPTVGSITFDGPLSFNGGSIVYDMNDTPGTDDLVVVNGNTDLGSGGTVVPNFLGSGPAVGTTYTFLQTGTFSGSAAGWNVTWPGRGTKPTVFVDGNLLKFTTTSIGAAGTVTWTGSVNGNWDIEGTSNWLLGGSPDVYFDLDNVVFDDTGSNPAVNVTTSVAPSSMVVNSSTNNYAFSGNSILSTGSLTKQGSSTLTLASTNEFAGGVIVEGGTLEITANNGGGTSTLELQGGTTLTRTVGTAFSSININGDNVTINNNSTGDPGTPSITGSGSFTFTTDDTAKTVSVNATETFSGTANFVPATGGTLAIRLGGPVSDYPNAVVNLTSTSMANRNGSSAPTATFSYGEIHADATSSFSAFGGGSTTIPDAILEIGGLNTNSNFDGAINDGTGGGGATATTTLRKIGSGELVLTGAKDYTGDTIVEGGTLSIDNLVNLFDGADVHLSSGTVLNLDFGNFGIQDTVDSLFIDGIGQATGSWGGIGSGAANESTLFTGMGLLNVLSVGVLPGDFDMDGDVDGQDFLIWQRNPTVGDLADWQANYPNPLAAAAGSVSIVPEPSTVLLSIFAACMCGPLFKRRK